MCIIAALNRLALHPSYSMFGLKCYLTFWASTIITQWPTRHLIHTAAKCIITALEFNQEFLICYGSFKTSSVPPPQRELPLSREGEGRRKCLKISEREGGMSMQVCTKTFSDTPHQKCCTRYNYKEMPDQTQNDVLHHSCFPNKISLLRYLDNFTSLLGQQLSRQACFVGTLKSQSSARWVMHIHETHEHDVQHISFTHSGQMLKPRACE